MCLSSKPLTSDKWLYNYKKADFCAFKELLSRVPWDQLDFHSDIEDAWTCWKDLFFSVVDSVVPTTRWKRVKLKHWFTDETLHLIHVKRRLYRKMKRTNSDMIKSKYKAISNLIRSKTRQDTANYISALSNSYSANAKKFWNFVNSVKTCRQPPPPLNHSGRFISDDLEKASIFNEYFNSVFTSEDCTNLSSLRESIHFYPKLIDTVEELVNLQRDKACGPDSIPAHLLKVGADFICSPLSRIFQLSLDSSSLPRDWITANVVPVHKKGDKHLPTNYRPISLTSIVVKVMERIIHCQLSSALESNNLISESQHGFRNKHSTITLLASAIDDWAACLERRNSVHSFLLDLRLLTQSHISDCYFGLRAWEFMAIFCHGLIIS